MEVPYRGSGKIYYSENEYQCDLFYKESQGGIVLRIRVEIKYALGDYLKFPLETPYLCGQIENGFMFTLLNLTRCGMTEHLSYGYCEYLYKADYILCGVGGNKQSEQTFHKICFTLSNIIAWGGETVYAVGENHELINKHENITKTIIENPDYKISYSVVGSMLPIVNYELLQETIQLKQTGTIIIEFNNEVKFYKFNETIKMIKSLFEVSMLRKVNIEKVIGFSSEVVYTIGDNDFEQKIEIYGKDIKEGTNITDDALQRMKWISFSDLINNNSFNLYFEKHEKISQIIELFLEPMYVEGSSTTRVFLNLVQALETYHSRFITNNIDSFKARIEDIVKEIPDDGKQGWRGFLLAYSNRFITLESRLADLLIANWKTHFDTGKISYIDFPSVIAHSRNYYIHYDERIKEKFRVLSEEELSFYNRSLIQILEYYILQELGFSNNTIEIKKKLQERWGNIQQDIELFNISRNTNNTDE